MSASIARSIIAKQLSAMGCQRFDVGILHQDGCMLLRERWIAEQFDAAHTERTSSSDHMALMRSAWSMMSALKRSREDGCRISASRRRRDFARQLPGLAKPWTNNLRPHL